MTAEEHRVIGGLENAVRNLEEQAKLNRVETQTNFMDVFKILRNIEKNGCARGEKNSADIADIRKGPDREVARVSALAAVVAAAAAVAAWFKG